MRSTSSGQPGHVVGLHVRLEDRDDRRALGLGEREVLVDQVDVRIDDREPPVRLAAEQVRGAGRLVVQQLAEEHAGLQGRASRLTSYQVIY